MSEIDRIYDQLNRAFAGGAWHGPALRELLADLTAERALAKPFPEAHSIWEIVLHISAWTRAVRIRLGGDAIQLTPAEDWPPIKDRSEAAWKLTLAELESRQEDLLREISVLTDTCLRTRAPGKDHTIYFMLHGLVQHHLYHAGQIGLLKRGGARTTAA